jgi:two-component system invasion response regulator UvrY
MKVLIVDDHAVVRAGLQRLLSGVAVVLEAETGAAGLALLAERPDLVILDLNLPGVSGLELIRRFRSEAPATPVMVLSMHADRLYAVYALKAGATGYVSKNASPDELFAAIGVVARGGRYVEQEMAQAIALDRSLSGDSQPTPREMEILRLLEAGKSLNQIAHALGVSYKTIANNCSALKAKLGALGIADLIRFAPLCCEQESPA